MNQPIGSLKQLPTWQDDDSVSNCTHCNAAFSMMKRKHHCRRCGKIFCGDCSNKKRKLPTYGLIEAVRLCDACNDWELGRLHYEEKQLPILVEGGVFKKHAGGLGRPGPRVVRLTRDKTGFTWHAEDKKPKPESVIYIAEIKNVKPGMTTDAFKRTGNKDLKHLCFSIIAEGRTLDLECDDNNTQQTWVAAIKACLLYGRDTNPTERKEKMVSSKMDEKRKKEQAARRKANQKKKR